MASRSMAAIFYCRPIFRSSPKHSAISCAPRAFSPTTFRSACRQRGAATTVMMLDACRNNPFKAGVGRSIGQSRGLSRMDTRRGMFVMFSAGAGQEALDRLGPPIPSEFGVHAAVRRFGEAARSRLDRCRQGIAGRGAEAGALRSATSNCQPITTRSRSYFPRPCRWLGAAGKTRNTTAGRQAAGRGHAASRDHAASRGDAAATRRRAAAAGRGHTSCNFAARDLPRARQCLAGHPQHAKEAPAPIFRW